MVERPESGRRAAPSDAYMALLRGHITAEEYVRRVKADVDARFAAERKTSKRDLSPLGRWRKFW